MQQRQEDQKTVAARQAENFRSSLNRVSHPALKHIQAMWNEHRDLISQHISSQEIPYQARFLLCVVNFNRLSIIRQYVSTLTKENCEAMKEFLKLNAVSQKAIIFLEERIKSLSSVNNNPAAEMENQKLTPEECLKKFTTLLKIREKKLIKSFWKEHSIVISQSFKTIPDQIIFLRNLLKADDYRILKEYVKSLDKENIERIKEDLNLEAINNPDSLKMILKLKNKIEEINAKQGVTAPSTKRKPKLTESISKRTKKAKPSVENTHPEPSHDMPFGRVSGLFGFDECDALGSNPFLAFGNPGLMNGDLVNPVFDDHDLHVWLSQTTGVVDCSTDPHKWTAQQTSAIHSVSQRGFFSGRGSIEEECKVAASSLNELPANKNTRNTGSSV